jgi:hypothetical protein
MRYLTTSEVMLVNEKEVGANLLADFEVVGGGRAAASAICFRQ